MTDQTEAAEVGAMLAVVTQLRERHTQGLVRIPSHLWAKIPALLDAAEKFLTADEAAAEARGAERVLAAVEAVGWHHLGDDNYAGGMEHAREDILAAARAAAVTNSSAKSSDPATHVPQDESQHTGGGS